MLWPEKRDKDRVLGDKVPGVIDRTTTTSYLRVPKGYLPDFLQDIVELEEKILPDVQVLPAIFKESGLEIGPDSQRHAGQSPGEFEYAARRRRCHRAVHCTRGKSSSLLIKVKTGPESAAPECHAMKRRDRCFWRKILVEPLLELSKCTDFVVNRGHYFGTDHLNKEENEPGLSDEDKRALIEFLKTF